MACNVYAGSSTFRQGPRRESRPRTERSRGGSGNWPSRATVRSGMCGSTALAMAVPAVADFLGDRRDLRCGQGRRPFPDRHRDDHRASALELHVESRRCWSLSPSVALLVRLSHLSKLPHMRRDSSWGGRHANTSRLSDLAERVADGARRHRGCPLPRRGRAPSRTGRRRRPAVRCSPSPRRRW